MSNYNGLKDIVNVNTSFKSSINLYLNLNDTKKVLGYIPTISSLNVLKEYLLAIKNNKEQATQLIGPYGKGKSHLVLVLLAIISLDRNEENSLIIGQLCDNIARVDEIGHEVSTMILDIWHNKKKFLPVIVSYTQNDLNQSFILALYEALKREGLEGIAPNTYYTIACEKIDEWKNKFKSTYDSFLLELKNRGLNLKSFIRDLKNCSEGTLRIFEDIYPAMTSGNKFNPMINMDIMKLYQSVAEKLYSDHEYNGIYVIFDEFSKFIENQNLDMLGVNMKVIQDIGEVAINSGDSQVFLSMISHKSIKEYGKYLPQEIINGYTGIEGRVVEKHFTTSSKNNYELIRHAIIKKVDLERTPQYRTYLGDEAREKYYQVPSFRSNFTETDFDKIVLKGCYPLNPIAAMLLLNISEKVAQNERTLFTFISNDESKSMARYISEHDSSKPWSIGADLIYDYFSGMFKKDVANERVHNEWLNAEYALSKCINDDQKRVVKTLAILLIVNKPEEIPATAKYIALAAPINDCESTLESLSKTDKAIIYKKGSTDSYVFKTRAGAELKSQINIQREIKGDKVNYAKVLNKVVNKPFYVPKKYNFKHAITRFFRNEYITAEDFYNISSVDVLIDKDNFADGVVLNIFSINAIDVAKVKEHYRHLNSNRIVVVCPNKVFSLKKVAKDYEIVNDLVENKAFVDNNEVLMREIPLIEEDLTTQLINHLYEIYDENKAFVLYSIGESIKKCNILSIENAINECCEKIYEKSPIVNNEFVNRQTISTSQTKRAQISVIDAVIKHKDDESFYSGSNQEATIYRSLFVKTGIITDCADKKMVDTLNEIEKFVVSSIDSRKSLKNLMMTLLSEPFGIRKALVPFYLAYVISKRKEDVVIYFSGMETALSAEIIINMCDNPSDYELFISKSESDREEYIDSLNKLFLVNESINLTDNRIKNLFTCMQRWYRNLPQVSRNIKKDSLYLKDEELKNNLVLFKNLLQNVSANPYSVLFIDYPEAFESEADLTNTFSIIKKSKELLEKYFEWLEGIVINKIKEVYQCKNDDLYHVLKNWYEKQSSTSKQGLYSSSVSGYMNLISNLKIHSDNEIAQKVARVITGVYLENWNEGLIDEFEVTLKELKSEIESIKDVENSNDKCKLTFTSSSGKEIEKYYAPVDEDEGSVLKNILEDCLADFDDMSVNDRVAILLSLIEDIIG